MSALQNPILTGEDKKTFRVDSSDPFAVQKLKWTLQQFLAGLYKPQYHQIIVLCIGTYRSTGDALGPLIGTKVCRLQPKRAVIYGTLEEPVHAINLEQTVAKINSLYHYPLIIAVDACLGRAESVGAIDVGLGPMQPGAGVNKTLPPVGQLHINGIVNVGGFLEYFVLQNTRLSVVIRIGEAIARGLYFALQSLPQTADTKKDASNSFR